MAWTKTGDNAATHPTVLAAAALGPVRIDRLEPMELASLLYGIFHRCAGESAGHTTDYFVNDGQVAMVAGGNWLRWARLAEKAGYWTRATKDGRKGWEIVRDSEFVHIRLKAEIDWDRQRKKDIASPALTMPVRLRDGDVCRYCGLVVYFSARRGGRRGTYDHRIPKTAATVETLVVACAQCNAGRGDDPNADERYPLLPEPAEPYFIDSTLELLAEHGYDVRPGPRPGIRPDTAGPARPRPKRDTAPRDPASGGIPRPRRPAPDVESQAVSAEPAETESPTRDGSGRVGSARDGTGSGSRRRRARRGRPRTTDPHPRQAPEG